MERPEKMDLWFVVYCQPRVTVALSDALGDLGVEVFCPRTLARRRVPRRNRVETVTRPMIAGLFFCNTDSWPIDLGRVAGVDTSNLRRMMYLGGPAIVKDEELEHLRSLPIEVKDDRPARPLIRPGDWVVVKDGPLKGIRLMAMRVSRDRVHTEINGARVTLSTFLLEKIEA